MCARCMHKISLFKIAVLALSREYKNINSNDGLIIFFICIVVGKQKMRGLKSIYFLTGDSKLLPMSRD